MNKENKHTINAGMTDTDEVKVAALLSRLPRVDPPGDFDTRVRSAIVRRRSEQPDRGASFFRPAWLSGMAAAAVMLAAGLWIGTTVFDQNEIATAVVQPAEMEATYANETATAQPMQTDLIAGSDIDRVSTGIESSNPANTDRNERAANASQSNTTPANLASMRADRSPVRNTAVVRPSNSSPDRGGSYDEAVTSANRLVINDASEQKSSVSEILRRAGVSGSMSGQGFVVSGVSGGASASGLQAGDVIVAVNGSAITAASEYGDGFRLRRVTIRRDGKLIPMSISN